MNTIAVYTRPHVFFQGICLEISSQVVFLPSIRQQEKGLNREGLQQLSETVNRERELIP